MNTDPLHPVPNAAIVVGAIVSSRAYNFVLGFAMLMVVLACLAVFSQTILRWYPPYKVPRSVISTPFVPQGGEVIVDLDLDRRRLCEVELNVLLIRVDDNSVAHRYQPVPGGATELGFHPGVKNRFRIPENLAPAIYDLIINVLNKCSEGLHVVRIPEKDKPPLRFEVISAKLQNPLNP
jgi:hypothetical protein